MSVVQQVEQLGEQIRILRGLQSFPCAQVDLDEKDEGSFSLEAKRRPSIAFLCVGLNMMSQMSLSMECEKTSCGPSIACGLNSVGLPSSCTEVRPLPLLLLQGESPARRGDDQVWSRPSPELCDQSW